MIRTVNHAVTVQASPTCEALTRNGRSEPALYACRIACRWALAGVRTVMALIAQPWSAGFQQRRNVRAVGLVAIRAILGNTLMLPKERPALLGVTGKAGLVQSSFFQHLGTG